MKSYAARVLAVSSLLFATAVGAASPAMADEWKMPDVEGELLQSATDAVLEASEGAVSPETSVASGPPFEQINLTYWEVCSQSPEAGEEVSGDTPPELEVARPNQC
ncbi:hypothetical protein PDG61_06205 [Mycolicibacterium sp. BiH015]|uniref:hypothetical protein n=1 Tax=Mycolicibacterium sp. BiH015 TaxID=3018808 RepID=UPI0022E6F99F|nr:hypothetical protein [Mycolicibacterium sp. BiH015]MDA2890494.1 hypothetical protein [Mycolicibacterium sp. BiH015]